MISLVIQYSKISVNMPVELLKEFDKICEVHSYSRAEGIKEAVRQFIIEQMPEEYYSPQMKQVMHEAIREQSREFIKGMAQAAADPEIQKLQLETAKRGMAEGMKAGIEQRFAEEQGISPRTIYDKTVPLSEEQKLQLADRLSVAREKTKEMQKEKTEAKQKIRKKI